MISTAAPPPSWAAGSPGDKNHRPEALTEHDQDRASAPVVDVALDSIGANYWERRVAHFLARVNSPRYARKVVAGFRDSGQWKNQAKEEV